MATLFPFGVCQRMKAGGPWEAKFIFCGTYAVHPDRVSVEPSVGRPGHFDVIVAAVPGAARPVAEWQKAPDVCPKCASSNVRVGCYVLECLACGWHHLNDHPCTVCGSPAFSHGKLPGKLECYGCREHPVTSQWGIDVERLRAEWQAQWKGPPVGEPITIDIDLAALEAPVIYGEVFPVINIKG